MKSTGCKCESSWNDGRKTRSYYWKLHRWKPCCISHGQQTWDDIGMSTFINPRKFLSIDDQIEHNFKRIFIGNNRTCFREDKIRRFWHEMEAIGPKISLFLPIHSWHDCNEFSRFHHHQYISRNSRKVRIDFIPKHNQIT